MTTMSTSQAIAEIYIGGGVIVLLLVILLIVLILR